MDTYLQQRYRERDPRRRLPVRPDGTPAPTGYFPDRSQPDQGQASWSPVYDGAYGPARQESLNYVERVDQHPWLQVSATVTAAPQGDRKDGHHDPMEDGPAAPTPRLLGLFYQRAQGSDQTRFLDAPGVHYPTRGSQDGASWTYFQDPRLAMLPYDPAPDAGGQMPDSLRALPPSPPHGWAEQPVVNSKLLENQKSKGRRQRAPRQDRLANSTYAGQTYSQQTAHVGRPTGTTPSRRPRG